MLLCLYDHLKPWLVAGWRVTNVQVVARCGDGDPYHQDMRAGAAVFNRVRWQGGLKGLMGAARG